MVSTRASVVITCIAPRSGTRTAASSPGGTISDAGAAGRRLLMCSTMARSPAAARDASLTGELNGAGLPDDGDLDLAGVLELILDPTSAVLRQPDGRLVGDAFALADD